MFAVGKSKSDAAAMNGVFIIGCPRSGTSALAWSLAQHPAMWTSAESDFLLDLLGRGHLRQVYQKAYNRPDAGWLRKHGVTFEEFAAFIGLGVDKLFKSRCQGKIWVDQTPGYILMASDLARLFPQARFIHLVRDGRAVTSSMTKSGFSMPWASDFEEACRTWAIYVKRGLEFEKEFPQRVWRVRQEDLVANSIQSMKGVLGFLELAEHEGPARFLMTKRLNSSYDNDQGRTIRSVKDVAGLKEIRWRDWTHTQRLKFMELSGEVLQLLGYSLGKEWTESIAAVSIGTSSHGSRSVN